MEDDFDLDEVVWAKVSGFPWWPAFISSKSDKNQFEVVFLSDLTRSYLKKDKIRHFNEAPSSIHNRNKEFKTAYGMAKKILNFDITLLEALKEIKNNNF